MSRPAEGRRFMEMGHRFNRAVIRGQMIISEGGETPKIEGGRISEKMTQSWIEEKHKMSPELLLMSVQSRRGVGTKLEELVVEHGLDEKNFRVMGLVNSYLDMCEAVCELYDDVWMRGKDAVLAWQAGLVEEIETYSEELEKMSEKQKVGDWDLAEVAR